MLQCVTAVHRQRPVSTTNTSYPLCSRVSVAHKCDRGHAIVLHCVTAPTDRPVITTSTSSPLCSRVSVTHRCDRGHCASVCHCTHKQRPVSTTDTSFPLCSRVSVSHRCDRGHTIVLQCVTAPTDRPVSTTNNLISSLPESECHLQM